MSYLSPIRLHFAGKFKAAPSTINNDAMNYNPEIPDSRLNRGWNPDGDGVWDFVDVTVTRVCYADGSSADSAAQDPIVGAPLRGTDNPFPGKIVDLDPSQQMVSQIWAFELMVGNLPSKNSVTGAYLVAPFNDLWGRCPSLPASGGYGAYYQSVLHNLAWGGTLDSRFLQELKAATGGRLSIKMNVDRYDGNPQSPTFTLGRVVGTIGPADDAEPNRFVAARLARPVNRQQGTSSDAQFVVRDGAAIIDLGNSLGCNADGTLQAQGPIQLYASFGGTSQAVGDPIPPEVYTAAQWYPSTAGIVTVATGGLDISTAPLSVSVGSTALLQENSAGAYLRADNYVYRLNPGEEGLVELTALTFGRPAAGLKVDLAFANDQLPTQPNWPTVGTPEEALSFPPSVTTGADGKASFRFTASAQGPGNPRRILDGQVYAVSYRWGNSVSDYNADPGNFLSLHLYDRYDTTGTPTWEKDVGPVFTQYARLYPIMDRVGMGDYNTCKTNAAMIYNAISLPMDAPNHMPATRDLSRDKVAMFKAWMDAGCPQS